MLETKEKMKNEIENLVKKYNELYSEKKLQEEDFQKVKKEKMAVDLQKQELEKLLILEKEKVTNLESELMKLKRELQLKTGDLDEFKLSMGEYFMYLCIYVFNYLFM